VTVGDGHFIKLPLGLKKSKKSIYRKVLVLTVIDRHPSPEKEENQDEKDL